MHGCSERQVSEGGSVRDRGGERKRERVDECLSGRLYVVESMVESRAEMCGDGGSGSMALACRRVPADCCKERNEVSVRNSMRATAWLNAWVCVRCRRFVVVTCFTLFLLDIRGLHILCCRFKKGIEIIRFLEQVRDTASLDWGFCRCVGPVWGLFIRPFCGAGKGVDITHQHLTRRPARCSFSPRSHTPCGLTNMAPATDREGTLLQKTFASHGSGDFCTDSCTWPWRRSCKL